MSDLDARDSDVSDLDVTVVIPTIGRAGLAELIERVDVAPRPVLIVVADDRPGDRERPPLDLPDTVTPLQIVVSSGRGPAAARNAGWRAATSAWVAFLDDDVLPPADWTARLATDLAGLPADVAGSQGRLRVPLPPGHRPTDEERRTTGLVGKPWITADLAYRRQVLADVGGFDERFPRAFREDCDLAVRVIRAGWAIVWGERTIVHPVTARGGWRSSIRAQAGNADNALLRSKYGRRWRTVTGAGPGRTGRHLLATGLLAATGAALVAGRPRAAALTGAGWVALTAEFAVRRIVPGPRTPAEIAAMAATSAVIPPVALAHRLQAGLRWRRVRRRAPVTTEPPLAVLFDRDGTLIHNIPYLADPADVHPVPGARTALDALRRAGVAVGVVSNQSGVARGLISPEALTAVNERVDALLGPFDTWQVCRHQAADRCPCRKPEPGMVLAAAAELGVRPDQCVMVGDIGADVEAGLRAGAHAVLVPDRDTRTAEVDRAELVAAVAPTLPVAVRRILAARTPAPRPSSVRSRAGTLVGTP